MTSTSVNTTYDVNLSDSIKNSLEADIKKSIYKDLFYDKRVSSDLDWRYAKMTTNNVDPTVALKAEIEKLKKKLQEANKKQQQMEYERAIFKMAYSGFVEAIIERILIPNPNHPANEPQRQEHEVISAIRKMKEPHASRYSVIENGGQ